MIDIGRDPNYKASKTNGRCILLFLFLCFVVWDSGYLRTILDRYSRNPKASSVSSALIIKSKDMTDDQLYTCASPVLDEIADASRVLFRVVSCNANDFSSSPEWVREHFIEYQSKAPCLVIGYSEGQTKSFDPPSSISEFKERIGAK